jgi:hypothetical protein
LTLRATLCPGGRIQPDYPAGFGRMETHTRTGTENRSCSKQISERLRPVGPRYARACADHRAARRDILRGELGQPLRQPDHTAFSS